MGTKLNQKYMKGFFAVTLLIASTLAVDIQGTSKHVRLAQVEAKSLAHLKVAEEDDVILAPDYQQDYQDEYDDADYYTCEDACMEFDDEDDYEFCMYACEADYYCDDYCGDDDECFEECMNHYGIYEEDLDALFDDEYFDSCEDMCMELDDEDDYETCMYACDVDYYCDDECGDDDECFEECMNDAGLYEEDLEDLFDLAQVKDDEYFDSCEDMCMELDDEDDYELCMFACDVDYYCDDYCGDDDEDYYTCEDFCMDMDDEDDQEACMNFCDEEY